MIRERGLFALIGFKPFGITALIVVALRISIFLRDLGRATAFLWGRLFNRRVGLILDGIVNDGWVSELEVIWHLWRPAPFALFALLSGGGTRLLCFNRLFVLRALGTTATTLSGNIRLGFWGENGESEGRDAWRRGEKETHPPRSW